MFSAQRWIKLVVVLLVLALINVHAEEGEARHDEGVVVDEINEAAETVTDYIENIVEEVAEVVHASEVKHVVEEVVEDIIETAEGAKSTTVKAAKTLLTNMKTKVCGAVDVIVAESKNVVERCKKMNKADVKKVAAAAVGIWGVAVGVGYLTKGTPPAPPSSGKIFATKKK